MLLSQYHSARHHRRILQAWLICELVLRLVLWRDGVGLQSLRLCPVAHHWSRHLHPPAYHLRRSLSGCPSPPWSRGSSDVDEEHVAQAHLLLRGDVLALNVCGACHRQPVAVPVPLACVVPLHLVRRGLQWWTKLPQWPSAKCQDPRPAEVHEWVFQAPKRHQRHGSSVEDRQEYLGMGAQALGQENHQSCNGMSLNCALILAAEEAGRILFWPSPPKPPHGCHQRNSAAAVWHELRCRSTARRVPSSHLGSVANPLKKA
mmetsp:Transcript_91577/g.162985  ORF Transcript_91577/g.162985 Transcript_91577/m.162985 type:complete len:260 (-) Transcript_91577:78-857(-)